VNKRKRFYFLILLVVGLLAGAAASYPLYKALSAGEEKTVLRESSYSELLGLVDRSAMTSLTFYGNTGAIAATKDGANLKAMMPVAVAAQLATKAAEKGVSVTFKSEHFFPSAQDITAEWVLAVAANILIFVLLGVTFYFMVLRGPLAGRSKAALATPAESTVRFADVAGCDGEKQELQEIVQFLRDPDRFTRLGGRVPAGVLMSGPPGTGKTLLARAVAGEAGVPFFSISGSDFVEMYVGVGAQRVRSVFAKAKKKAPCILFIDEIDAVGRSRSNQSAGGAHEEREQTLNQLLVEMDGFKPNCGVVVIAATNRPEILDKALTRPGRFSRNIVLQNPDIAGREKILAVHADKVTLDPLVDLHVVARGTPGFSGADLANLVNEAAIMAARSERNAVMFEDFEHAKDRILMGNERRSLKMSEDDRRLTAYHEAGHALVAIHCPASDPIHKVTIVPRGRALGMVVRLPENDSPAIRRSKLLADLAVAMGGRAAEELIFGADDISTGASGDIQMASQIARRMVAEWGMSDRVGAIAFDLGPIGMRDGHFSESTAKEIDYEVRDLILCARQRALDILVERRDQLDLLAVTLLEKESLSGAEVGELLKNWEAAKVPGAVPQVAAAQ
jgi:cell division protease FtsH